VSVDITIDGLTALRRVDPDDVAFGAALVALMQDAGFAARIETQAIQAAPWFTAGEGLSFQITLIDGRAVPLSSDRISDAVAALDAIDPMLVVVERTLGVSMDAEAMTDQTSADSLAIALATGGDTLRLAIPKEHSRREDWILAAAALPHRDAHMPCIVRIDTEGPRLSIAEASDLSEGDLLFIVNRAVATLIRPHLAPVAGMFDLTTGSFSAGQNGASMPNDPAVAAPDFMVPLTIRLPDRMTSAASLASLGPGITLPLGPLTEGMPVELRVAGRLLASGELVQLGDRFAVLIEARADIADVATEATE
jgi:flagellar motor switch/type III secretory pathway protein FliN